MNEAMRIILLVEDSPDDIALALHAFERSRIMNPIVVVRDGIEALDFLFARGAHSGRAGAPPPMIILDLKLPKLDGLGVLKAIRNDPRIQQEPVIILTSSKEEEDRISGYTLGITRYLRKPVDFTEFIEAVKALGAYWLMIEKSPQERILP
jgi:two-component system, response regulator